MRRPSDDQADGKTPPREEPLRQARKPYRSPRLITYGKLPQLALVKGGARGDGGGGAPASKV
ncbi:MAG TPA: hypothetical protein VL225_18865 [Vicinamibacterales bacterium]|jgi:hypothetical protein|nr:hypothetical protein [Vicinamibacterales bacterium]